MGYLVKANLWYFKHTYRYHTRIENLFCTKQYKIGTIFVILHDEISTQKFSTRGRETFDLKAVYFLTFQYLQVFDSKNTINELS